MEKTKTSEQESLEDRKRRLRAQRDALLKMKQDQRKQELTDFNEKTKNKQDLHKELREIDQNMKQRQAHAAIASAVINGPSHVNLGEDEVVEMSEVDKRLMMYRNMRNKLMEELEKNKQSASKAQMEELNRKIAALEKAQREKE